MTAMPCFSLAHLTAIGLQPPELIRVASRTGYQTVGLRLIAVTADSPGYPLMSDPALMRETKAAMVDTGVGVLDIEFVKITPEINVAGLEPFVAAGAELGAKFVVTAPYDPDLSRLADRLGAMSDLCGQHGMHRRAVPRDPSLPLPLRPCLRRASRHVLDVGAADPCRARRTAGARRQQF